MWQPTELRLIVLDRVFREAVDSSADATVVMERRTNSISTPATLPPPSLVDWARAQLIVQKQMHKSIADLYQQVVFSLQSIQDKISRINSLSASAFWDFTYGPHGKIIERLPKKRG